MRRLAPLLLVLCAAWGNAQQSTTPKSLFLTVRPDVTLLVEDTSTKKEATIGTVNPNYPADLLRSQIETLGKLVDGNVRGLRMEESKDGKGNSYLKVKFGINNLIDHERKVYRLQEIARAFAGAPDPYTVHGIHVTFAHELGDAQNIASYSLPGVVNVEAMRTADPNGPLAATLEYRIELLTQDASKIVIPEHSAPPKASVPQDEPSGSPMLFYVLLGLAALAAGALVYLALLRANSKTRR
jgi:hypothetical protein